MSDPTPEQIDKALYWLEERVNDLNGRAVDAPQLEVVAAHARLALQLARERAEQIEEGPVGWLYRYTGRSGWHFTPHDPESWRHALTEEGSLRTLHAGPPEDGDDG